MTHPVSPDSPAGSPPDSPAGFPPWLPRPLFNPGPVTLTPGVRAALSWPEISHRDPEFLGYLQQVRQQVSEVYPALSASHQPVVFAGSGATAVDALVLDATATGGSTAVLVGGPYAQRMLDTTLAAGREGYPIDLRPGADISAVLTAGLRPGTRRVAVVHHDTATATVNDLTAVAAVCDRQGLDLVVDSVSSFACEPLLPGSGSPGPRTWWATCSNKALEGAPGLAVCLRPRDLPSGQRAGAPVTADLARHAEAQERGDTAFTLPTQIVAALGVALAELRAEGGWAARRERYQAKSRRLRAGLRDLGLWPVLEGVDDASALTLAWLPRDHTFEEFSLRLGELGLRAYSAQGPYQDRCFRISSMGATGPDDFDALLAAVGGCVR